MMSGDAGTRAGKVNVYWLEQREADVPVQNDWLSAGETARLKGMRFEKRRADFRLGRWTAKRALAVYLNRPADFAAMAGIEIRPEPSGAPEVFLAGELADVTISLSHRAGTAICAVAASSVALGCDLEVIEPRSDGFLADYFTKEEQAFVARMPSGERSQILALLWSAKESALKALREGLRLDTRSLRVEAVDGTQREGQMCDSALTSSPSFVADIWHPLCVRLCTDQVFQGWWQHANDVLRTMVAAPSPSQPIPLAVTR
jgi:4'-phosphopantetheinyl transferase